MKVETRECSVDGHKSSRTTEVYTYVTHTAKNKMVSPLDNLDLKNDEIDIINLKKMKYRNEMSASFVVYNSEIWGVCDKNVGDTNIMPNTNFIIRK